MFIFKTKDKQTTIPQPIGTRSTRTCKVVQSDINHLILCHCPQEVKKTIKVQHFREKEKNVGILNLDVHLRLEYKGVKKIQGN